MQEPVKAFFAIAMVTNVGNGMNTFFGTDNWLHGSSLAVLTPLIFAMVPKRIRNRRTVRDALQDLQWTQDIHGALSVAVFAEFLELVNLLEDA